MILSFVVRKSHGFSFVFWATIGLARKKLPNVNQFFESLYTYIQAILPQLMLSLQHPSIPPGWTWI